MRQLVTLLLATGLAQQGESVLFFPIWETAVMTKVLLCYFATGILCGYHSCKFRALDTGTGMSAAHIYMGHPPSLPHPVYWPAALPESSASAFSRHLVRGAPRAALQHIPRTQRSGPFKGPCLCHVSPMNITFIQESLKFCLSHRIMQHRRSFSHSWMWTKCIGYVSLFVI